MGNLLKLKARDDLIKYAEKNNFKVIGNGSEGTAYLLNDSRVLKVIENDFIPKMYSKDIIMHDDFDMESFLFPYRIYFYDRQVVGYVTEYFKGNIFDGVSNKEINLDSLAEAREKMIDEIRTLTKENYFLYELPRNLLFDGKRLAAVETLDFYVKPGVTLDENIDVLDSSIMLCLSEYNDYFKYTRKPNYAASIKKYTNEKGKVLKRNI